MCGEGVCLVRECVSGEGVCVGRECVSGEGVCVGRECVWGGSVCGEGDYETHYRFTISTVIHLLTAVSVLH